MKQSIVTLAVALAFTACSGADRQPPGSYPQREAACVPAANPSAPSYAELYARYFAVGTPGHCAAAHCHGAPGANVWSCGDSPATCYDGMARAGLIDRENPSASSLADPQRSPLLWINPSGDMPLDESTPLPAARDAILAWVAECAPDD